MKKIGDEIFKYERLYHIFAWGIALILSLVPWFYNAYGAAGGSVGCGSQIIGAYRQNDPQPPMSLYNIIGPKEAGLRTPSVSAL